MHLRMAPGRRTAGVLAALAITTLVQACGTLPPAVKIGWTFDDDAAGRTGDTRITVELRDPAVGRPIRGARLNLEAHMSHPGMAPVVSTLTEGPDGHYAATLPLTMTGEWHLVTSGALADGQRVMWEHTITIRDAPAAH
jgi:hypothetical protein